MSFQVRIVRFNSDLQGKRLRGHTIVSAEARIGSGLSVTGFCLLTGSLIRCSCHHHPYEQLHLREVELVGHWSCDPGQLFV
jgi:hypothetical protein